MGRFASWALALGVLGAAALIPQQAEAKRGVAIINWGEDIFEAGPLPEALAAPQVAHWKAGYKCSVFGVFWAYFAWWDCQPVAFDGDTYDNQASVGEAIAAQYTEADVKMGFWARNGRWVFLGVVLLGVGFVFLAGRGASEVDIDELDLPDDMRAKVDAARQDPQPPEGGQS